jgi:hypothetical protein
MAPEQRDRAARGCFVVLFVGGLVLFFGALSWLAYQ